MWKEEIEKNLNRMIIIKWFSYVYLVLLLVPYTCAQSNSEFTPGRNTYRFDEDLNPSMAITIIVLICAFFFMGFFAIYIRQCVSERRSNGRSVRPDNRVAGIGRSRRGNRGLDPTVIQTFPIFIYSDVKNLKIGKGNLECAVCLNEFEDEELLRLLPICDHVFHPECIDAWLVSHSTCPVCRSNLKPLPPTITDGDGGTAIGVSVSGTESDEDDQNHSSEMISEADHTQVSIFMTETSESVPADIVISPNNEMNPNQNGSSLINPNEMNPIQNRSRSINPKRVIGKFPRSHSTGHSLIQPGENCERFTLRLPEDVRKEIFNGKLNRSTSCLAFNITGGDGSVSGGSSHRRGYRSGGGEGSSRGKNSRFGGVERLGGNGKSDRWVFSMTPPFFSRTRSTKIIDGGSRTSSSVKTPFDCLGSKADEVIEPPPPPASSSARPPV